MAKKSKLRQSAKVEANSTTTLLEIKNPTRFLRTVGKVTASKLAIIWKKWLLYSGLVFIGFLLLMQGLVINWYVTTFQNEASISVGTILSQIWSNRSETFFGNETQKTVLFLGVDQSSNQRENSMLTDVIMMMTIFDDGKIVTTSFPRDLWIDPLKTKVNALYYYGQQDGDKNGIKLLTSVLSEITGKKIDYYLVINMDTLKDLLGAIGGIKVNVARSFVDEEYPREIDISSSDPSVLYETVSFEAGEQHLSPEMAMKFIRSRKSKDLDEGNDEAREARQQLAIAAIKAKIMSVETFSDPILMGKLYKVWKTSVISNVTDVDLYKLAKSIYRKDLVFESKIIPIKSDKTDGLLYHPQVGPGKQWVYLPVDSTWEQLKSWFNNIR